MGWNCASIWYHLMDPVFFFLITMFRLVVYRFRNHAMKYLTIIFYISHSWLKHLNFHFENLQDSIAISSLLVQGSSAYRLLMGLYLRRPFTPSHSSSLDASVRVSHKTPQSILQMAIQVGRPKTLSRDFDPPFLPARYINEVPVAVVEQRVSRDLSVLFY